MDNQLFTNTNNSQPIISPTHFNNSANTTSLHQHHPHLIIIALTILLVVSLIAITILGVNLAASEQQIISLRSQFTTTPQPVTYLDVPSWQIRFKYPAGVTAIVHTTPASTDDTLTITSIAKDGIVYDVKTCNNQNTFLGRITRHIPSSTTANNSQTSQQFARIGQYEYFESFPSDDTCAIDNKLNTDFEITKTLIRELTSGIESY